MKKVIEKIKKSSLALGFGIILFLLASLITISQGFGIIKNYFESTLGYEAALKAKIEKLSAGINIDYFRDTLGVAHFVNKKEAIKRTEYIFVNEYYYVQAITDETGSVLAYSVTTRDRNFNPVIKLGPYSDNNLELEIKLGKTKFSELDRISYGPPDFFGALGFHNFFYGEQYYFGNPGNYQNYYFAMNESGYQPMNENFYYPIEEKIEFENPNLQKFRKAETINTYTVTAPLVDSKDLFLNGFSEVEFLSGFFLGPYYNQVRVLE